MRNSMNRVCMIGLGYIGLPTAAVMASRGLDVLGVDINQNAVNTINNGEIHIIEPDLDIVVRSVVTEGKLRASTLPESADVFMVAVPTPFTDDNKPDLSYVEAAAKSIASVLEQGNLVILESTSPVGTTEKMSEWIAQARPDLKLPHQTDIGETPDIHVAHCPERVLPGQVLRELVDNDRIIGGITTGCAEAASRLYRTFVKGDCLQTSARTAELCKLTENASRDVGIAFANELSLLCEHLEIDVWELISLANRHPRVNILEPGPGVGGHCIAVDPWFIVDSAPKLAKLIKTARQVNDSKPVHVIDRIRNHAERFKSPTIACFGLAFKANIDDLRESPSVEIVEALAKENIGQLLLVEPNIDELPTNLAAIAGCRKVDTEEAIRQADIIVILVDHKPFRNIDATKFSEKIVIDTRGLFRRATV